MVLKVSGLQKGRMLEDIEREKKNSFYLVHPAVSQVSNLPDKLTI